MIKDVDNNHRENIAVPAGDQRVSFADLIERLEKATGPDRELDFDIAMLLNAPFGAWESFQKYNAAFPAYTRRDVAAYTGSIDAALTLVPYQREWHTGSVTLLNVFWAEVVTPTNRFIAKGCKTPATALCLAALKARAEGR